MGRKGCLKGLNWTLWWLKRTIGGGKGLLVVEKDYCLWIRTIVGLENGGKWKIWKMENMEIGKYWRMENMGAYRLFGPHTPSLPEALLNRSVMSF